MVWFQAFQNPPPPAQETLTEKQAGSLGAGPRTRRGQGPGPARRRSHRPQGTGAPSARQTFLSVDAAARFGVPLRSRNSSKQTDSTFNLITYWWWFLRATHESGSVLSVLRIWRREKWIPGLKKPCRSRRTETDKQHRTMGGAPEQRPTLGTVGTTGERESNA